MNTDSISNHFYLEFCFSAYSAWPPWIKNMWTVFSRSFVTCGHMCDCERAPTFTNTHILFLSHAHTTENQKFSCNWTRKVFRNINTIPYAHIPNSTKKKIYNPTPINLKEKESREYILCQPNSSQPDCFDSSFPWGRVALYSLLSFCTDCSHQALVVFLKEAACRHRHMNVPGFFEVVEPLPTTKSQEILHGGVS